MAQGLSPESNRSPHVVKMKLASQLWDQFLELIPMPSTRMLVRQNCRLVSFTSGNPKVITIEVPIRYLQLIKGRDEMLALAASKATGVCCLVDYKPF